MGQHENAGPLTNTFRFLLFFGFFEPAFKERSVFW